jgi:superoxide reductase
MPKINRYSELIQTAKSEAKVDYVDRHSPFVYVEGEAVKGQKLKVKVRVGKDYAHPMDFDHYIAYVQLWDGNTLLGHVQIQPEMLGNQKEQVEVDFYIVPMKKKLQLHAMSYCTKHGLWESDIVEVEVKEPETANA